MCEKYENVIHDPRGLSSRYNYYKRTELLLVVVVVVVQQLSPELLSDQKLTGHKSNERSHNSSSRQRETIKTERKESLDLVVAAGKDFKIADIISIL